MVISNVSRGTLYKKIPKDMTGKAEYIYAEHGRLILYKKNKEKQGDISVFPRKEFWGNNERNFPWGEHYTPVQEKKKRDTGKDSARWNKSNYFTIK